MYLLIPRCHVCFQLWLRLLAYGGCRLLCLCRDRGANTGTQLNIPSKTHTLEISLPWIRKTHDSPHDADCSATSESHGQVGHVLRFHTGLSCLGYFQGPIEIQWGSRKYPGYIETSTFLHFSVSRNRQASLVSSKDSRSSKLEGQTDIGRRTQQRRRQRDKKRDRHRKTDSRIDRQLDWQTNRRTDGRADGRTDGRTQTDRYRRH